MYYFAKRGRRRHGIGPEYRFSTFATEQTDRLQAKTARPA